MPIETRTLKGVKKFRWGKHGKWYSNREDAEKQAEAAYSSGYTGDSFVFDRASVRQEAEFGRLEVTECNISKACVNPYYGREIPDYQQLGLDENKIYMMLRDPEELKKAESTFNSIPLIENHPEIPDTPDTPSKRVGTTGSETKFKFPYLVTSLKVWDNSAIAGIKTGKQKELSSGYTFVPDMTAGEFEGTPYDGRMTNIVGNHVAFVRKGRAGSDVVVGDSIEGNKMSKKLMGDMATSIKSSIPSVSDSDADELAKKLLAILQSHEQKEIDEEKDEKVAGDEKMEKPCDDKDTPSQAKDEKEDNMKDKKDKSYKDGKEEKTVGDSEIILTQDSLEKLIESKVNAARQQERENAKALQDAKELVKPLIGSIVGDSAEEIYRTVLEKNGVEDAKTLHSSALQPLVNMLLKTSSAKNANASIVGDSSSKLDLSEC